MRVGLGELELLLDQAGAAAGVDQPARARFALDAVVAIADAVLAAAFGQRDVANQRAGDEADAAPLHFFGEEVLEHAAVDLVARHGEVAAGADLGDGVDVAPAFRREEAKAELLQLRGLEVRLQAEHLGEVVGADLDRRLADLVRGDRHRVDAPLEDQDVELGERLLELQRERESGQAAAGDDDVVPRRVRAHRVASATRVANGAGVKCSARLRDRRSASAPPDASAIASSSGRASAIALPAIVRAAGER